MIGLVVMAAMVMAQTFNCDAEPQEGFTLAPQGFVVKISDPHAQKSDFDMTISGNSAKIVWSDSAPIWFRDVRFLEGYSSGENLVYTMKPIPCSGPDKLCGATINLVKDLDGSMTFMMDGMSALTISPPTRVRPVITLMHGVCVAAKDTGK